MKIATALRRRWLVLWQLPVQPPQQQLWRRPPLLRQPKCSQRPQFSELQVVNLQHWPQRVTHWTLNTFHMQCPLRCLPSRCHRRGLEVLHHPYRPTSQLCRPSVSPRYPDSAVALVPAQWPQRQPMPPQTTATSKLY